MPFGETSEARPPENRAGGVLHPVAISIGLWIVAGFASYLISAGVLRLSALMSSMTAAAMAIVLTGAIVLWVTANLTSTVVGFVVTIALAVSLTRLSASIFDMTWDGVAIHLPLALDIQAGWNPVWDEPMTNYSLAFPNGLWTLQALLLELSPTIDGGKSLGPLLVIGSVPILAAAIRTLQGGWRASGVIALIALLSNPILVAQLLSYEVDGALYVFVLLAFAGAVLISRPDPRLGGVVFAAALILLVNVKITGAYWAAALCGGLVVQQWIAGRRPPVGLISKLAVIGLIGVVVVGWRPYVVVPLEHGVWVGAVREIDIPRAPNLRGAGPLTQLTYAAFGRTSNPIGETRAELKWPWQFSAPEFGMLLDLRIGGFGPAFGLQMLGAILLATSLGIGFWRSPRGRNAWLAPYWTGVILVMTALFPEAWWARLAPSLWIVTVLPLIWPPPSAGRSLMSAVACFGAIAVVGAATVNAGLAAKSVSDSVRSSDEIQKGLRYLASIHEDLTIVPLISIYEIQDNTHLVWSGRLTSFGVAHRLLDKGDPCPTLLVAAGNFLICRLQ